jgi:TPR repeat protein
VDPLTRQQLIDATEGFHEENNWPATEALWRPYVEQGDLEAQFRLAYHYLFYSFDEEAKTRAAMVDLLRTAADRGHADAAYWMSHLCPEGEQRDGWLLKAGRTRQLRSSARLRCLLRHGRLDWSEGSSSARPVVQSSS